MEFRVLNWERDRHPGNAEGIIPRHPGNAEGIIPGHPGNAEGIIPGHPGNAEGIIRDPWRVDLWIPDIPLTRNSGMTGDIPLTRNSRMTGDIPLTRNSRMTGDIPLTRNSGMTGGQCPRYFRNDPPGLQLSTRRSKLEAVS